MQQIRSPLALRRPTRSFPVLDTSRVVNRGALWTDSRKSAYALVLVQRDLLHPALLESGHARLPDLARAIVRVEAVVVMGFGQKHGPSLIRRGPP